MEVHAVPACLAREHLVEVAEVIVNKVGKGL